MTGIILIALGGALGSVLRYGVMNITHKFYDYTDYHFPLAILLANMIGCFAIGAVWAFMDEIDDAKNLKLFLITGILGGFTTFSTFAYDNFNLLRLGKTGLAAANILVSNICGVLMVFVSYWLVKIIIKSIKSY